MFPMFAASLMSGASSLIGSIFSSETSAQNTQAQMAAQQQMQSQTEQFNAGQAQINRDYQTQMSNTAYQRASADMQKAGLNPAMMFGSGGAASSPGGAQASVGTPSVPVSQSRGALSGLGDAVDKMVSTALAAKTFDKMTEDIANLRSEQALRSAQTRVTQQEEATAVEETKRRGAEADLATLRLPAARFSAKSAEDLLSMPEWLRSSANIGSWGGRKADDVLMPFLNSASGFGRVAQGFETLNRDKMNRGNFIGKYGVPIDEYLAQ